MIPPPILLYRCMQCGIESAEASCFIGVAAKGPQLYPVKCITCSQPTERGSNLRPFFGIFGGVFFPMLFIVALRRSSTVENLTLLLAAVLMQPLLVASHELGHFLTARAVGLEPSLISLGIGPTLWRGKILGVPLRVHGWPTSGLTYLGSRSLRFLRLRVFLTILMGPITNILLLVVAVAFYGSFARSVGANIVLLWILLNAFFVLASLLPYRHHRLGQSYRSDGLQLLQVPLKTSADLAVYLAATPVRSALELFKESDFAGARDVCLKGLERLPGNPWLRVMLSACQITLGEFNSALVILKPLHDTLATQIPEVRGAVLNNLALAIWLQEINTPQSEQSTPHADELSARAFSMYPCVLAYRSTRALLLVATNRPNEALALLEYSNYERGTSTDRGDQYIARAFAFRRLNRTVDAEQALIRAMQINKTRQPWILALGLFPDVTPSSVA